MDRQRIRSGLDARFCHPIGTDRIIRLGVVTGRPFEPANTMTTRTQSSKDVVLRAFDALNNREREAFDDLHSDGTTVSVFGETIQGSEAIVGNQFGLLQQLGALDRPGSDLVARLQQHPHPRH